MEKGQLRRVAEERRRQTRTLPSGSLFAEAAAQLVRQLGAGSVAAYYPFGTEPDLRSFLDMLPRILVPRLFASDGSLLPTGQWGLHRRGEAWEQPNPRAPRQPGVAVGSEVWQGADLVLIPALAVSESGDRLGRGGGWYDRVLERLPQRTSVYAVVYSWEVWPAGGVPVEPHDRPVHGVLTEFGASSVHALNAQNSLKLP